MSRSKKKIVDWTPVKSHLPSLHRLRSPFDANSLKFVAQLDKCETVKNSPKLAAALTTCRTNVPISALETVFGTFSAHHSFNATFLDWSMRLREPDTTRTLAKFLNEGPDEIKLPRLHAFLAALGTPNLPPPADLKGSKIYAEQDRIDLEIWIPRAKDKKFRPVIVEAKFDHKITKGQLKKYTDARRGNRSLAFGEKHCVVLGLSDRAMRGVIGKQNCVWNFVSWRALWLKFEKLRPHESNPSLSIFLRLLWHRIGELN